MRPTVRRSEHILLNVLYVIQYAVGIWQGLARFLDAGRIELETNPVESQICPITLTRKNAHFAGHEVGAENGMILASFIATCKMSDVNPIENCPKPDLPGKSGKH